MEFVNNNIYYDTKNNGKNINQLEIDFIIKKLEEYKTKYENIDKKPIIGINLTLAMRDNIILSVYI